MKPRHSTKFQKERIIGKLLKTGIVTRNECLRGLDGGDSITRLSHYANMLEDEGWKFEARYSKDGKDYGYILKHCPLQKEQRTLPDGRVIVTYTK